MRVFFKMQLKMFYRQKSSYIIAIVLTILNIAIALALFVSLKVADPSGQLANSSEASSMFRTFMVMFGTASGFMTSAFTLQTLFYKYKEEGIYYVMQSKPITRFEIYTATIGAGTIALTTQILITSLGYFVGTFFIPALTLTSKFTSWITFFLASLLIGILSMGIGAIGHNFIQSKSYQFLAGWIPTIFVLIFFFLSTPAKTKTNIMLPLSTAKNSYVVRNYKNDQERQNAAKFVASPYRFGQYEFEVENRVSTKTNFVDSIKEANLTLYNRIYWMDVSTYFSSIFFMSNRKDGRTQEYMYTKYFNYTEDDFQKDLKEGKFIFKVIDKTADKPNINYFAMSYNPTVISELTSKKKSNDSFIEDLTNLLSDSNQRNISKRREKGFLELNDNLISKLDEVYKQKNGIFNGVLPLLTVGTLPYLLNAINNDEDVFNVIRDFIADKVEFNQEEYSKEKLMKMTKEEILKLKENPLFTNYVLKYNLTSQTAMIYLINKIIKDKYNSTLENFNANVLKQTLSSLNTLSTLKLIQWNNGSVVKFGLTKYIDPLASIIVLLIISAALLGLGAIAYVRNNNL